MKIKPICILLVVLIVISVYFWAWCAPKFLYSISKFNVQKYYTVMDRLDNAISKFWGEDIDTMVLVSPSSKHLNLTKIPREKLIPKDREGIWNIFQDAAIVLDGLFGVGRYDKKEGK